MQYLLLLLSYLNNQIIQCCFAFKFLCITQSSILSSLLAFCLLLYDRVNETSTPSRVHLIHVSLTTLPSANARVPLNLFHQKKNERRRRFYVSIPDDKSPVYVFGDVGSAYQKVFYGTFCQEGEWHDDLHRVCVVTEISLGLLVLTYVCCCQLIIIDTLIIYDEAHRNSSGL